MKAQNPNRLIAAFETAIAEEHKKLVKKEAKRRVAAERAHAAAYARSVAESVIAGSGDGARMLRETSGRELAELAVAAMSGRAAVPARPVVPAAPAAGTGGVLEAIATGAPGSAELLQKASLEDLGLLASAAAAPGRVREVSPFWRGFGGGNG